MPYPKKDLGQPNRPLLQVRIPYNLNLWLTNLAAKQNITLTDVVIRAIQFYKGRHDHDN